jgi:hypothetical protein
MFSATTSQTKLLPKVGARPLVGSGLVLGAIGMIYLTGIGPHSSYATHVLPALIVMGLGFGLIFAPAISSATLGVDPADAGVASAMVNTMQQIGGSIGTALLSTLAASATTAYLDGAGRPTQDLIAQAAVHGYTTAFYWSAAIFVVAAVVCTALLRPGVPAPEKVGAGAPAMAH